jgi:hypothetical protein
VASFVFFAAETSCGADGFGLGDDCLGGGCLPIDASLDAGAASDASSAVDVGTADGLEIGSRRSPLCAVSGCFPGFTDACGSAPPSGDTGGTEASNLEQGLEDGGDEGEDVAEDAEAPAADAAMVADDAIAAVDVATDTVPAPTDAGPSLVADARAVFEATAAAETSFSDSAPVAQQSCYVSPTATGVVASCAPAGPGMTGDACRDSRSCGMDLACVQIDGAGICRPFSCGLPPSCPPGSFYQLAPLLVTGAVLPNTVVPVCLPNIACSLLTTPRQCVNGKVCAVVGNGGETSCVTPGSAKRDEFCDESTACAEGLVCAIRPDKTQNRCLQLCHIDQNNRDQAIPECPGGTCQGGNMALPMGFGICVGDNPDAG